MRLSRFRILLLVLILHPSYFLLLHAAPLPAPGKEELARWVRQLGDADFATREQASQLLWKAGRTAEPALQEALKNDDLEVQRRAQAILDKFQYGIYPDTPEPVVKLIERYRAGDQGERLKTLQELIKLGRPGYAVVRKLAALEKDDATRRTLFQAVADEASQAASVQLADGHPDAAAELLELGLATGCDSAARDYAAFLLSRGTLKDRLSQLEAGRAAPEDKEQATLLVFLHRANGDLKNARRVAEQAGLPSLLEGILAEQGDWPALVKPLSQPNAPAVSPAARATYQRLAGNTAEFETELGRLAGAEEGWTQVYVLLFNDRPREAIAALGKARHYSAAFELLTVQLKYREAFDLVDKAPDIPDDDRPALDILMARSLYQLGDKDKALARFAKLGGEIAGTGDPARYAALVRAEYRLGLQEQAFGHLADLFARSRNGKPSLGVFSPSGLFSEVFAGNEAMAEVWWKFLEKKFAREAPAATLKRLRQVLDGKIAEKNFTDLAEEMQRQANLLGPEDRCRWLQALAEASLLHGKEALARGYLEEAANLPTTSVSPAARSALLIRLGDFHADRKQWKEAAKYYARAWETDRKQPLSLYLHGWALKQSGADKEGDQLVERAHGLPLANEAARYAFIEALGKRGHVQDCRRECDFLRRTADFHSVYLTNILSRLAGDALSRKDYFRAADCFQQILINALHDGAGFTNQRAYLLVPYWVHFHRARGLMAAGRVKEASKEIECCLDILPGEVDLPIALVPELDRAGHKKEADELFDRVFAFHGQLCADYPQAARWHNGLGWLAARCHRQLDRGLEHARKAVALEPQNAGLLDTLAEVHFQRGDKDRAIELMKKCITLDDKTEYFRKQLRRFEAGDPAAEPPPEG